MWKSNTLYLERGFAQLLGTLRVGDMYTSSDIFDSVRFSGVRLFRDMQMLPNSKQNVTPRVQGIAQSNALVTIEQNGFVVYQKEVPPGPFAITDLQLAGGGADLDVSVKEADGSVTTYLVPYAAVPNMLQPGVSKYDFAAGRSHIGLLFVLLKLASECSCHPSKFNPLLKRTYVLLLLPDAL